MLTHPGRAASITIVVFSSFVIAGCVTRKIAPVAPYRPPRATTLEEVVAAYDGFCKKLDTLSASGDLEVRDLRAGRARKIGVRVLAGRGGRLYLKGSVAVVTALEIVANGERFWFRLPAKKTIWTGAAEEKLDRAAESDQAPYYALRPADIVSALLPETLEPMPGEAIVLEGDHEVFSLTLARLENGRGIARRRVSLERETLRASALLTYDGAGTLLREVRLSAYQDDLPRRIVVARPREGYEAELGLDKVEANVTLPEKTFAERPAEGYTVVEVGKKG